MVWGKLNKESLRDVVRKGKYKRYQPSSILIIEDSTHHCIPILWYLSHPPVGGRPRLCLFVLVKYVMKNFLLLSFNVQTLTLKTIDRLGHQPWDSSDVDSVISGYQARAWAGRHLHQRPFGMWINDKSTYRVASRIKYWRKTWPPSFRVLIIQPRN